MGFLNFGLYDRNLFKGRNDVKRLGEQGQADYAYGKGLVEEGLGGLRGLRDIYEQRVNDPLGDVGRNIFARARGAFADDFTRTVNSGDARRRQLATQTGGALTAEQIASLDAEDRRAANEELFGAERELAISEGEMTLSEAQKFFDRMEGIDKTIGSVGSNEKTRGLEQIFQNLMMRWNKDSQKRQMLYGFASSLAGAATGGAASGGGAPAPPPSGSGNVWGIG